MNLCGAAHELSVIRTGTNLVNFFPTKAVKREASTLLKLQKDETSCIPVITNQSEYENVMLNTFEIRFRDRFILKVCGINTSLFDIHVVQLNER